MKDQMELDFDGKNRQSKELLSAWSDLLADHPEFADIEDLIISDLI
jgi:hypothetical protein